MFKDAENNLLVGEFNHEKTTSRNKRSQFQCCNSVQMYKIHILDLPRWPNNGTKMRSRQHNHQMRLTKECSASSTSRYRDFMVSMGCQKILLTKPFHMYRDDCIICLKILPKVDEGCTPVSCNKIFTMSRAIKFLTRVRTKEKQCKVVKLVKRIEIVLWSPDDFVEQKMFDPFGYRFFAPKEISLKWCMIPLTRTTNNFNETNV